MIEDGRFWIFLIILLLSAYATAQTAGRIRKRKNHGRLFYIIGALAASLGLWLNVPEAGSYGSLVFHISNALALVLGAFIALFPYLFFIPLLLPPLLSLVMDLPLKPLLPEKEPVLGTLQFMPSQEGTLAMVWDDGETKTFIRLEGEEAAVFIMSCRTRPAFFFLKDLYLVRAVTTKSLFPEDLEEGAGPDLFVFSDEADHAERFFSIHYPAPRFLEPGFFEAWTYLIRDGDVSILRR